MVVIGVREQTPRLIVVVDVSGLTDPDQRTLDGLIRLQLQARRLGASIRLRNARSELVELLALLGLSEVLPELAESAIDTDRLAEEREQPLVDEVVDPGYPPV
jgi:anti-anti-sigma regulatory factor